MAGLTQDVGTGATLTLSNSSNTLSQVIREISWGGATVPAIATSHLGTGVQSGNNVGNATYIPGRIHEPGTLDLVLDTDTDLVPAGATGGIISFVGSGTATATITLADDTGATTASSAQFAGTAFVTDYGMDIGLDELVTENVTLQFSGNVGFTSAAA